MKWDCNTRVTNSIKTNVNFKNHKNLSGYMNIKIKVRIKFYLFKIARN